MSLARVEFWRITDTDPDLSWLEQTDEQMGEGFANSAKHRLATYGDGWWMVGIRAALVADDGCTVAESPGLWGIESDSDDAYFDDIAEQELAYLVTTLGLPTSAIDNLPTEWRET